MAGLAVQDLVTILGTLPYNAIDAAADGKAPKQVELTVESDAEGLDITLKDSGSGIDPAPVDNNIKHGFTTKATGTGMGLSLCRIIVEEHGGRLWASRGEEYGATFHMQLRAAVSAPQEEVESYG